MKDFVVTEQRGTLLPSDVMWNRQIAGRKSLPHSWQNICWMCGSLLCPAFIFPGTSWLPNKNPAPTFWKVFRFYPRFVTKRSVGKHQGSLSKVHSNAESKLCIPLKMKKFQKMRIKTALPMPRPWEGSLVSLTTEWPSKGDMQLAKCAAIWAHQGCETAQRSWARNRLG